MRFTHLAEQIYFRPWFITAEGHASIRLVFERALQSGLTEPRAAEMNILDMFPKRRPMSIDQETGIASIHILGPLGKNLSKMEQSCGATGFEQIDSDYAAAQQQGARGIFLDFDSPGGTAHGTPERAAMIAAKPLPTVAYTEDYMCSAAYFLAAGADMIVASPSAIVGSIGTYMPWADTSEQYARAGIKPDPIVSAGSDLKALGFGGTLSPAQREHLQTEVDQLNADFKTHIRNFRAVGDGAMRGQSMTGKAALSANLIDRVGDRQTAFNALARTLSAGSKKLAA